ncbi:MAG: 1-deoxy-D-xylulose-5-phosphate synthase [Eubacteriales bacterium]|nr:1-deoxy-D-xylulose-5-phosphate synthase [Eubacteriales bacterium]MDD4681569.1 1-deoxy-D-xylulose-5-phosphate synthase [Eubacteriales bacterium]
MSDMLSKLNSPEQLHDFDNDSMNLLADELRRRIIETVAKNGGHLASNLGMVELTLALFAEFNFCQDKIVLDVGHQCYAWKLLTGRSDKFSTIRRKGGLSGFPKRSESSYDFFNTGHSSTSISAALGLARAMEQKGDQGRAIAVIGDGALTGGMAFEALNDAGQSGANLIVILNDNQMSISKNVGGMSKHLENLRISRGYINLKSSMESFLNKLPLIGKPISGIIRRFKSIDRLWLRDRGILFEQLGFKYYGPIDGHDIQALRHHLAAIRKIDGPVLLHVLTQKGRGYSYAEEQPDKFHGIAPFVIESGVCRPGAAHCNQTYSSVFGQYLLEKAQADERIIAVSAAMTSGTGLTSYADKLPSRFFDVGIAEQHALTMAAGLAAGGMKPVAALYSTFLQRAYDQLLHDICLQKLPVVIAVDRAGLVGEDGETHQGLFDLGLLLPLPNIDIYCPVDEYSLRLSIDAALDSDHPTVVRYPRSSVPDPIFADTDNKNLDVLYGRRIASGTACTVVVLGVLAENTLEAVKQLKEDFEIDCDTYAVVRAKPFRSNEIIESCRKTGKLVVIEEGLIRGGFGESILPELIEHVPGLEACLHGVHEMSYDQAGRFELLQEHKLDSCGIISVIRDFIAEKHN